MTGIKIFRRIMNIREFLEMGSSRLNADILADKMEEDPGVFDEVWDIMLEDSDPVSMRAAWSISIFCKKNPRFIEPRLPDIVRILPRVRSGSIRRCLLNLLTLLPVPEDHSGFLFDYCFELIESPGAEIAHKAYAMTILYNISNREPELKRELIELFESKVDDESAGVDARSRILLEQLYRDLGLPRNVNY
jgi:hypothetical protein